MMALFLVEVRAVLARFWPHIGLLLALAVAWHFMGAYQAEKALRKADQAAVRVAVDQHIAAARRAVEATEAKYTAHAKDMDNAYQAKLADARAATADYVRRLRTQAAARNGSTAATAAEDRTAGVLQAVPASAELAVSERDLQACSAAYVYAVSAREWALGLAKP